MAYGRVIRMDNGQYKTPNKGTLEDLETGLQYDFTRPIPTTDKFRTKWNVQVHDIVTFTIEKGVAVDVVLYKNHRNKIVYKYS